MVFRRYFRNPFKKLPENCFKQAESLIYSLEGTIKDNGTAYEIFKSEETIFNFDGEGKVLTIPFRIVPQNGSGKDYYFLASKNGDHKLKLRWEEELFENMAEPDIFIRRFSDTFLLLPSEKNKNIN